MTPRYGIVIDMDYCVGCGVCVVACKQENDLPPYEDDRPGTTGITWNRVFSITEGTYPDLMTQHLTVHCMHCENPPCMPACPRNAIGITMGGMVLIYGSKCNACKDQPEGKLKCIPACPYKAIQFNAKKAVAQACTLCVHRVNKGLEPACVKACTGKALIFGDLNDLSSKASQAIKAAGNRVFSLKPEAKVGTCIRYVGTKKNWHE